MSSDLAWGTRPSHRISLTTTPTGSDNGIYRQYLCKPECDGRKEEGYRFLGAAKRHIRVVWESFA